MSNRYGGIWQHNATLQVGDMMAQLEAQMTELKTLLTKVQTFSSVSEDLFRQHTKRVEAHRKAIKKLGKQQMARSRKARKWFKRIEFKIDALTLLGRQKSQTSQTSKILRQVRRRIQQLKNRTRRGGMTEKQAEETTKKIPTTATDASTDTVKETVTEQVKVEADTPMTAREGLDIPMTGTGANTNQGSGLPPDISPPKARSRKSCSQQQPHTPARPTNASQASLRRFPSGSSAFEHYTKHRKDGTHAPKPQSQVDVDTRQAETTAGSSRASKAALSINTEKSTTGDRVEARLRSWCTSRFETNRESTQRQA